MSDGGKGDQRRPTDEQKFRDNFDKIFGKKNDKPVQDNFSPASTLAQQTKG